MRKIAYLSLGSNMGNLVENLREAIGRLESAGHVISVSSFYETEPVEFTQQAWFVNCAVSLETTKTPEELMKILLRIEHAIGRRRTGEKGPRTIDIDILLFGDMIVDSAELTIPHPAMHERRFVLQPLAEIAAEVQHPILKRMVRELRDALPAGQAVRKLQTT